MDYHESPKLRVGCEDTSFIATIRTFGYALKGLEPHGQVVDGHVCVES